MRKTSKAYFNIFKKTFLEYQESFGLTQYRIIFRHEKLNDYFATLNVNEQGKLAVVSLATKISRPKEDDSPESHAKHEAIHLLLYRLGWLGEQRWTASDEAHDEMEAIVTRLEKVLN